MRPDLSVRIESGFFEGSQNWIQAPRGIEIEWDAMLTKPIELSGPNEQGK
jgi:hypothetical protein